MYGHGDVVAQLVQAGADVNKATTTDGTTPLLTAAFQGHGDVVGQLVKAGADVNKASTTANGATPLFYAAQHGHLSIFTVLAKAGARTGTVLAGNGATDLWAASWKGHADVVQYLLDQPGVEIDRASTATGPTTTPLGIATAEGHAECVTILKEAGASL